MENTDFKVRSFAGEAMLRQQVLNNTLIPRIIGYKHIQIVYIDFSNLKKAEEIYSVIENAESYIHRQLPRSLYILTNLTGMHFNNEIFNHITAYAKGNNPFVKRSAVVGMSGMMQIFYNTFTRITGREVRAFNSEIDAKQYLLGE
jgi:hypothetical protein